MATKKTSSKTTVSARATPKKLNGTTPTAPKPAKTATAAQGEKASAPKVRKTARAEQGAVPAKIAKPAEAKQKVAAPRRKNAVAPVTKTQADTVAAPLAAAPPAPARPSRDEIAAHAAALWRQNGGPAFDNWIRAERELGA